MEKKEKKNNPNARQENILKYLSEHGEVSTSEITKHFTIAKSTLSEDIKYLKSKGYPIVRRHGFLSLMQDENRESSPYYEKLCPEVIRKWIILYNANIYYRESEYSSYTVADLYNSCHAMYSHLSPQKEAMSEQVFFKDVRELLKDGYLKYSSETVSALEDFEYLKRSERELAAPMPLHTPIIFDRQTAHDFHLYLESELNSLLFYNLKERLKKQWPDIPANHVYSADNLFIRPLPEILNVFMRTSYKTNCLDITCLSDDHSQKLFYKDFETVMIMFFADHRKYYLLGKGLLEGCEKKDIYFLPFSQITDLRERCSPNTRYKDPTIQSIFQFLGKPELGRSSKERLLLKKRYEESFLEEYGEKINGSLS